MMRASGMEAIVPELAAHGIRLTPAAAERLERYAALLLRWNRRINLVGTQDAATLWRRHLLDCLLLETVPAAPELRRWLDVGSGAGLPAVPLAIVHPEREISAAERVAKKATFLREVARELALDNLLVLHQDAGRLAERPGFAPFDAVVARAFAPLPELLALGAPLLRPGGELWAMKGRRWEAEARSIPPAVRAAFAAQPSVHGDRLEDGGAGVVLVYRRCAGPPTAFTDTPAT